ncbi:ABC bile acid transporter [Pyrenophora seminiperda CCB06]|uniref:ABC bile acid transporter n=1 Tax=Pyrenophora seminiperda CCB06 TaxID=1302712 RepID=A0A3M7MA76_9PLEO|nr:ABC bile acid transporter [Pyrenophora seminiperda CCB06]
MVLDEATSAVDMATDQKIQRSIRDEFTDSTLIVIAHRLSTIADFDKVLVMEDGRGECDTPARLMKGNASFRDMLAKSGEKDMIEKTILGGSGRTKRK